MLELEDLIPRESSFTLSATEKTYTLRPLSLDDEVWLKRKFGSDIERIFKQQDMEAICRIIYHQLDEESKAEFGERTVTFVNEEGQKASEKRGGVVLLQCMIRGTEEKKAVIKSLLDVIGVSRPTIEKVFTEEKKSKKPQKPTGEKSSTPSPASTDGQPNTSEAELVEKSANA